MGEGEEKMMSKQRRADLMLLLVTAFWGVSYYFSDICLKTMPPMTLTAFRFVTGFALLFAVFLPRLRRLSRATAKYALFIGLSLTGSYIFYGYGLLYTSISNAAFLCALSVVFTPLLGWVVYRKPLGRRMKLCLVLCVAGLAMLTLREDFRVAFGDILCLGTPLCYAVDLLLTEKAVADETVDPVALGVCALGVVAVITTTLALILEKPCLPGDGMTWFAALFLGIACSGAAFVIQSVEQRHTTANHVGLIFTMEPVFATALAFFLADERLTPRGYAGAAVMLLSLLLMELDWPKKKP